MLMTKSLRLQEMAHHSFSLALCMHAVVLSKHSFFLDATGFEILKDCMSGIFAQTLIALTFKCMMQNWHL